MNLREAAQQALDALEYFAERGWESDAIIPLRDALEPVTDSHDTNAALLLAQECESASPIPGSLYSEAAQMLRKQCTEIERLKVGDKLSLPLDRSADAGKAVEPVAWLIESYDIYAKRTFKRLVFDNPKNMQGVKITEYYTAPPKREPLTEAEIGAVAADIWGSMLIAPQSYQKFASAIERAHGIGGEE